MVYFYYPVLAVMLRFRRGKSTRAEMIHLAEVGATRLGKHRVRVFILLDGSSPIGVWGNTGTGSAGAG